MRSFAHFVLAFTLLLAPLASVATETEYAAPNTHARPTTQIQYNLRDPFTPSNLMYEIAGTQGGSNAYGFMPSAEAMRVPPMRLRGFLREDGGGPVALLEIGGPLGGGRTYLVREGDEINIDPAQPRNAIRITRISRLSITVETGMLGKIRILR